MSRILLSYSPEYDLGYPSRTVYGFDWEVSG